MEELELKCRTEVHNVNFTISRALQTYIVGGIISVETKKDAGIKKIYVVNKEKALQIPSVFTVLHLASILFGIGIFDSNNEKIGIRIRGNKTIIRLGKKEKEIEYEKI